MCRPNIHQILLASSNEEGNEEAFVTHMYTKIQSVNSEQMRPLVEVMVILKWIYNKIV
jgi:pyruvate formate-lyase activating enzyme-like uncharacterized protein